MATGKRGQSDDKILELIEEEHDRSRYLRYGFERDVYANLLFKQGHQWIVWDEVARRFRQKKLKPWIPTPVTNKFSAIGDALVSLLLRVQPEMTWRSKDANDQAQISIAETMSSVLDRVKDQTQFKFWRQELATWLVYSGNGYIVNSYNPEGGSKIKIPYMKCDTCNHSGLPTDYEQGCPNCQSRQTSLDVDELTGMPKEEEFTGGLIDTEIATFFEMYFDFAVPQFHRQTKLLRVKQRPLDYFKRYGVKGEDVQAEGSSTLSEFYASTLAYLSSGTGVSSSAVLASKRPGALEKFYTRLPDDDFPNGLYAIAAGGKLLERQDLPCHGIDGKPFLPIQHISFDLIPGSAIGKTVLNDLRPKQKQRNELESLIQLITMRMANPVWIVPYGTDVEGFSGQPGAVLKAIQLSPNASGAPTRLPGENVPSSVMAWLEKIDKDMEDISATYDILKGTTPAGITAGYAIQLLIERGNSRWGGLFQRWETGFTGWAAQVTAMCREHMPAEQILELLGPHGEWEVGRFKEEDLGLVMLEIEAGSTKSVSALTEQALLDNLLERGLINGQDPTNKATILRSLGMSKYDKESDWDMKDAAREEEAFLLIAQQHDIQPMLQTIEGAVQAGDQDTVQEIMGKLQQLEMSAVRFRPEIDNNIIHLWSHKRFAKTDKYLKLSAEWQAVWMKHVTDTMQRLMMDQMQAAQSAQAAMPPPKGGPPGGPPPQGKPKSAGPTPPGESANLPASVAASKQGGHRMNPAVAGMQGIPQGG